MNVKNIAIVGATGAVGREILTVLDKRNFPIKSIRLFSSKNSKGKILKFKKEKLVVEELTTSSFKGIDLAFFSAGNNQSFEFVPHAISSNSIVIDNSSAFRMNKNTPLVIPEINSDDVLSHKGLISNPNCSTIILLMGIYPIHRISPIKRIIVSTYQSVSGSGYKAILELRKQSQDYLSNNPICKEVFNHQIAFNLFSHDSIIDKDGYNTEEKKMLSEVCKILHDQNIKITATCVRVPIFRAHCEAVNLEFTERPTLSIIKQAIKSFSGVKLVDEAENNYFPMPIEASNKDQILVGRIRYDLSSPRGLCLFISGDQLLKGAALNAVQIAEIL